MSLRARRAGWGARFDGQALQAFTVPEDAAATADWPALRAWCLAAPAQRFAVAVAVAAPAGSADAPPDAAQRAAAMALQLDGSHALMACRGAAARLVLRLGVKWQDLRGDETGSAALPATRIWDSGRARGDAQALARFRPRRPTFIVVDRGSLEALIPALIPEALPAVSGEIPAASISALTSALTALHAQSAGFAHPVRVLWLLPGPAPAGAIALAEG